MRWNTFGRSAVFAALAGIAVIPWLLALGPLLGMRAALSFYLVTLTALYVSGCAPALRPGLGAGIVTIVLGAGLALMTRTLPELTLGLAVLLATARAVFLYRLQTPRGVVVEVALIGGGLLFARFLAGPSLLSVMFAVWGFLLVQSFFFLFGGVRNRAAAAPSRDPFDAAYDRAAALLAGLPT